MAVEKTLKLKRIFAFIIHNSLKNTPSKEYATGELKALITDIIPSLRKHIDQYVEMSKKVGDMKEKFESKEIKEEDLNSKISEINDEWKAYSKGAGSEVVDIVLSEESMKSLNSIFNKENGGKLWTSNIDEYAELMNAFAEAVK